MKNKKPLDRSQEKCSRERIFQEADKAYAKLQADPKAWHEELKERALWETTLLDGWEDENSC